MHCICLWNKCRKIFKTEQERFKHIKEQHIHKDNRLCKWEKCCGTATNRWNLVSHMKKHLDVVYGVCYLCNKGFKRGNEFKIHFKCHSQREKQLNAAACLLLN